MHRARTADKGGEARLRERAPREDRRLAEALRVKTLIDKAGLTCLAIDRIYGLSRCTASNAVYRANVAGERAIAAALKSKPHLLWPSRYHGDGTRLDPQPAANYERPASRKVRREKHGNQVAA